MSEETYETLRSLAVIAVVLMLCTIIHPIAVGILIVLLLVIIGLSTPPEDRPMNHKLSTSLSSLIYDERPFTSHFNNSNANMFMSAEDKAIYLKSAQWKQLKQQRRLIANNKCERCLSSSPLELHHITYKNLGNENIEDLALVCRRCHQHIHNTLGKDRIGTYPLDI